MKKTRLAAALLSAVIFSGCAAPESSSSYLTDESPGDHDHSKFLRSLNGFGGVGCR